MFLPVLHGYKGHCEQHSEEGVKLWQCIAMEDKQHIDAGVVAAEVYQLP